MSRRKKLKLRRAEKVNEAHRLMTLPGEIRITIYLVVLEENKMTPLEGLLGVCKSVRAERLAFVHNHNRVHLYYNVFGPRKLTIFKGVQSVGLVTRITTPKIVFEASRNLEFMGNIEMRTVTCPRTHLLGVIVWLSGDICRYKTFTRWCADNGACRAIVAATAE